MNNKTLKSSIKAYCLELMKEMNSLGGGGEGAYMTKFAGRKVTSKDKTSPTGFETSPKNNYYKKFKFRVTNPYPRKNSKQLWNEIKIEKPGVINLSYDNLFKLIKKSYNINENQTEKILDSYGFPSLFMTDEREKIEWWNEYHINDKYNFVRDLKNIINNKNLKEIKIEKPGIFKTNLLNGDENPIIVYKKHQNYQDNREEIEKSLSSQGYDDVWNRNEVTWSLISFPEDGNPNKKYWWADDEINWGVNENKKEFIHRINKEIYQKLDEINNHIEYTSKIKGSEDKEINELNNLKNSLLKIKSKINEIKIK